MNKLKLLLILALVSLSLHIEAKKGSTVGDLLKKIESQAELKKSKSHLPKFQNVTSEAKKSNVNLKSVKPPTTSQLFYSENSEEAQLQTITDAGIRQLYILTQKFKNSSKRGELWLRLAELYVEKARIIEYGEYNKLDKKMAEYEAGKTKVKPKVNLNAAKEYNKKAIQLYEWFLRDFPKDEKVPQALFFLGYNFFELGNVNKGKEYYTQLTTKYPKSEYVDESNFALAEYYFENDQWQNAESHYRKVAQNPRSRLYAFAMYKAAWCLYKQGKYKLALDTVEKVILKGRRTKGLGDRSTKGVSSIRLANEALKDIVVFFAEAGNYKEAYDYFVKVAGSKSAPALYEKLANYYLDRGARTQAKYILDDLVDKDPLSPKAFESQYKIVTMFSTAGNSQIFKDELFKWIEQYGPGSAWQKANSSNKVLIEKSELLAEATLRNYILQNHQTAQNSRAKFSVELAQNGYNLYFVTFANSKRADEMHFFYGELLYDMKNYNDAGRNYMWVVENSEQSSYYKQSLLNAILSLEKGLPTNAEIKEIVGQNTQPIEFDKSIKNFEKLAKLLFVKIPEGENVIQVKYKLGTLYYYYNQFDPALTMFNEVIKEQPKSKFAEYSANLILDIYNLKKDYIGLEKAADELLKVPGLKTSNIGRQIKATKQRSAFKRAENLEDSKNYVEAANSYLKFAHENPKSSLSISAYYNAGINFDKGGDYLSALTMYEKIAGAKITKSKNLQKNANKFLGPLYEKLGRYPEAAKAYESYASAEPKDNDSLSYIFNAAVIHEAMLSYSKAIKGYESYLGKSKKSDRWDVLFYIGKIWEERKNYTTAIKYFEQYMNSPTKNKSNIVEAAYRIGVINETLGRKSKADEWYKKTLRIYHNFKKTGARVGSKYASEADFKLVYPTFQELVRLKIPKDPKQQAKIVQSKLNLVNRLKEELKRIVKYDDAFQIVAALTLQGQALQHMSSALYNAPLPPGLDAEQSKIYKEEIDKLAKPLKDQAIENYKAALERGYSLGGYSDWMKKAIIELEKIVPGAIGDNGEKVFYITRLDLMGDELEKDVLKNIQERLSKNPEDVKTLNMLGVYYLKEKQLGLANFAFGKGLLFDKENPAIYNNLGVIEIKKGDIRQAIVNFKKALSFNPKYKPAQTNLSSIYLDYKDFKSSIGPIEDSYDDLKKDLSRGSVMAVQAANNYAVALVGLGDNKKAKSIYEKIMDGGSRDVDVMMNYAILLAKVLKEKTDSIKIFSKIKFTSEDPVILNKIKELEKELDETK
ncbi:MAG: tetratricopeptide repeat protein [Bdellovibrionaceae bacterium]|nr:tetratricopeptide repeat protein [Pseudobdellovibrionaceae bacterium]